LSSDCLFCEILVGRGGSAFEELFPLRAAEDQVLMRGKALTVIIDVAPIGPGHCLILPNRHELSFGLLEDHEFQELSEVKALLGAVMVSMFGRPPVFFEHGQCLDNGDDLGCGIGHAHLHCLASGANEKERSLPSGQWTEISGVPLQKVSAKSAGYLYVEFDGQEYYSESIRGSHLLRRHFQAVEFGPHDLSAWLDQRMFPESFDTRFRVEVNLSLLREGIAAEGKH
jgi:diadenosine tetraphosphate (Ap4A) HIT family hydrolase